MLSLDHQCIILSSQLPPTFSLYSKETTVRTTYHFAESYVHFPCTQHTTHIHATFFLSPCILLLYTPFLSFNIFLLLVYLYISPFLPFFLASLSPFLLFPFIPLTWLIHKIKQPKLNPNLTISLPCLLFFPTLLLYLPFSSILPIFFPFLSFH